MADRKRSECPLCKGERNPNATHLGHSCPSCSVFATTRDGVALGVYCYLSNRPYGAVLTSSRRKGSYADALPRLAEQLGTTKADVKRQLAYLENVSWISRPSRYRARYRAISAERRARMLARDLERSDQAKRADELIAAFRAVGIVARQPFDAGTVVIDKAEDNVRRLANMLRELQDRWSVDND